MARVTPLGWGYFCCDQKLLTSDRPTEVIKRILSLFKYRLGRLDHAKQDFCKEFKAVCILNYSDRCYSALRFIKTQINFQKACEASFLKVYLSNANRYADNLTI
jgi:hypothetical protein